MKLTSHVGTTTAILDHMQCAKTPKLCFAGHLHHIHTPYIIIVYIIVSIGMGLGAPFVLYVPWNASSTCFPSLLLVQLLFWLLATYVTSYMHACRHVGHSCTFHTNITCATCTMSVVWLHLSRTNISTACQHGVGRNCPQRSRYNRTGPAAGEDAERKGDEGSRAYPIRISAQDQQLAAAQTPFSFYFLFFCFFR